MTGRLPLARAARPLHLAAGLAVPLDRERYKMAHDEALRASQGGMRTVLPSGAKSRRPAGELHGHKLFAPPAYSGAIRRTGLLDRMFAGHDVRVIVCQAPAGHGKSTVLQQAKAACEDMGERTGWLTLDEADNDFRRLQRHLEGMLASLHDPPVDPAGRDRPGEAAGDEGAGDGLLRHSDWFLGRLADIGGPSNIFFDEFQHLTDRAILLFFRRVLEYLPPGCRIFMGSRALPDMGLARLVVHGQAIVLTPEDMRFSPAEAERFFTGNADLGVRPDEVDAMYRHTEGWPAALQLFRLSLASPDVRRLLGGLSTFRLPELTDYLADSVLAQQAPRIQEFLLRTSLLTQLSASLCDAVTGCDGSQEVLMFLERSGLFTRHLDSERRWFRYHTLFSSFLQSQLRLLAPEVVADIHRRALDWYRRNDLLEEAMHHALALQDYAQAAEILDGWADQLIAGAYLATVERWSDRLPLSVLERRPDLAVKIAWPLVFLRRQTKLRPILELMERQAMAGILPTGCDPEIVRAMAALLVDDLPRSFRIVSAVDVHDRDPDGFQAFELGAAANLLGFQAQTEARFDDAREYLVIARAFSERAAAIFSWGYALGVGGMTLLVQGRLNEALEHLRVGMAEPMLADQGSYAAASLASVYCLALYEAGALDEAEARFGAFRHVLANATLVDFCASAYVTIARIHDVRGCPEQAAALLDEAEEIGFANGQPRLVRIVNWERVRRALLRGELDRATAQASRIRPTDWGTDLPETWLPFAEDVEGDSIGRIRLQIPGGQIDGALRMIARELGVAQRANRVRRQIKLLILEAVAQAAKGFSVHAQRALQKALRLAEPGGFVRTFLDEGETVVALLQEQLDVLTTDDAHLTYGRGVSATFVERLIEASRIGLYRRRKIGAAPPLEPLTDREVEILRLLGSGVSNREMADRIFVSENTIKFHLKNIYSKLAVGGRFQAINAARAMGLI